MKKIVILLIAMFITITNASALTIDSLGFTSDDISGIEFVTRDNKEKLYYMYTHDIYAMNENDDYIVYVRSVNNPFDKNKSQIKPAMSYNMNINNNIIFEKDEEAQNSKPKFG